MNKQHGGRRSRRLVWTRLAAGAALGVIVAAAVIAAPAHAASEKENASTFPTKPIRLLVPFQPGGAVDLVARVLAKELTTGLKQSVIVENRTGASGNIAGSFVAKSDPDGYILLMGSTGNSVNSSLFSNLNYDPDHDLEPLGLVGTVPTILLANPKLPVSNVKELLALAKDKPNSLNFGAGGLGTTEGLSAAMFNLRAGTTIKIIDYRGGAQALTDLMAGQIQLMFTNQLNATPYLKAGTLKALGIATEQRSKDFPNIPTMIEQGMPGFTADVWWGVFGPAHIPPAIARKLNESITAAAHSPGMEKQLRSLGATVRTGTQAEFAAFYTKEAARWHLVVQEAHVKAE